MSIIWLLFVVISLAAAVSDLLTFRIPNMLIIAFLLLFAIPAVMTVLTRGQVPWGSHIAAGLLSFCVGLLLYGLGQMGAGDAKLLAVVAFWAGLSGLIPLLLALAISGLIVSAIIVGLRVTVNHPAEVGLARKRPNMRRVLQRGEGIPYGIGIAMGAIAASKAFPVWLWMV